MKKISITENDVTTLHMIWETPQEIENIWFRIQENKEQSASHPYYHDQEFNANDLPYQYLEGGTGRPGCNCTFFTNSPQ